MTNKEIIIDEDIIIPYLEIFNIICPPIDGLSETVGAVTMVIEAIHKFSKDGVYIKSYTLNINHKAGNFPILNIEIMFYKDSRVPHQLLIDEIKKIINSKIMD